MDKKTLGLIAILAALFMLVSITVLGITNGCSQGGGDTVVNIGDPQDSPLGSGERTDSTGNSETGNEQSQENPDHSGEVIPDNGTLPERMINVFVCSGIYQQAVPSEIDAERAFAIETVNDIVFGPAYFSSSRYLLELCSFEVNEAAEWDDLRSLGIDVSGLIDRFGGEASICSVRIFSGEGEYKTTVFLIDENTLIAFGEGMHIFEYELVEAVG